MKQTKDAGLVSCGLEEYLINKLDRETSKTPRKKDDHATNTKV